MNACNARRFGVINIHKGSSTQFHFSTKVVEKFKELDQNINVEGTNGSGNIVDKSHGNEKITQESPGNYTKALSDRQKMMKHAVSGHVPTKPLVSVSWHRHDENHGKLPGFFSDYSQPRMRTPSHN
ncbi:hypothetical protein ACOSQ2_027430 [Xanthoceras sorbifolium]